MQKKIGTTIPHDCRFLSVTKGDFKRKTHISVDILPKSCNQYEIFIISMELKSCVHESVIRPRQSKDFIDKKNSGKQMNLSEFMETESRKLGQRCRSMFQKIILHL